MRWKAWLRRRLCPAPSSPDTATVSELLPEIRRVHRRLDDLITSLEQFDKTLTTTPRPDPAGGERTPTDAQER